MRSQVFQHGPELRPPGAAKRFRLATCGIECLERRTLPAFVPQGPEFRVNTATAGDQGPGTVAFDAAGNFVITWTSSGQGPLFGDLYARRYDAAGAPQGGELRIDPAGPLGGAAVSFDAAGGFVVAWRYNAAGVPAVAQLPHQPA